MGSENRKKREREEKRAQGLVGWLVRFLKGQLSTFSNRTRRYHFFFLMKVKKGRESDLSNMVIAVVITFTPEREMHDIDYCLRIIYLVFI